MLLELRSGAQGSSHKHGVFSELWNHDCGRKNLDAFMGIELVDGALSEFGGQFIEPEVFEDLSEEENEVFTAKFDAPAKQKYPCQWD